MVTTRRSSYLESASSLDPFKDRKLHRVLGEQATGIQRLGRGTLECFQILETLFFLHSVLGLWFRILQVLSLMLLVFHAWKVLLPLLIMCGLVRCHVTSTVKDVKVDQGQWDELSKAVSRSMRMEITTVIRTRLSKRSYFFCIGNPHFLNPMLQKENMANLVERIRLPPRRIVVRANHVATTILNDD